MSKKEPFGIYIHIPYCKAKCRYCDFYSAPGARGVPQSYVDALLRELAGNTRRPDTVYFGGGTPGLLSPAQVDALIQAAAPLPGAEITLEANPDIVTSEDLLSSREVENIFENSDFVYMLNQAGGDRQILAKQLGISTHQLSYVTHSGEGEGLLFYGSTILPFVDHFPKNTELYRIMSTKPQELKKEDE